MKTTLLKWKKSFYTSTPNKIEWGMTVLVCFLIFTTMYYADNRDIFHVAYLMNEEFFNWESVNFLGVMIHPYGVLHQWICELWVLPINLLACIFEFDVLNSYSYLWFKLCIPVFLLFCMKELEKIAETLEIEKKNIQWMGFLFLTTVLVALPVFHVAQTDCIYLLLMFKGFHTLIKKDTKRFLLWFALANSFKMISLFIFIPLVLLSEKRIGYVIRNILLGCVIIPAQQVWYRFVGMLNGILFPVEESVGTAISATQVVGGRARSVISTMQVVEGRARTAISATQVVGESVGTVIPVTQVVEESAGTVMSAIQEVEERASAIERFYSRIAEFILHFEFPAIRKDYTASLLIFLFALFCIWCYMQKTEDTKEWRYKCLYASVISLAIFFITASPAPYWIVIMYPFLFLLIYYNQEKLRFNLLLEKVFTLTLFLVYIMSTYWVYGGAQTFDALFLGKWGIILSGHELQGLPNIAQYIEDIGMGEMMPIVVAICLAGIIGLAWLNYPNNKYEEELSGEYKVELQHGFAMLNIGILIGWYVINVLFFRGY